MARMSDKTKARSGWLDSFGCWLLVSCVLVFENTSLCHFAVCLHLWLHLSVWSVCSQTLSHRWAVLSKSVTSWMPSTYQMASHTSLSWLRRSRKFLQGEEAPPEALPSQSTAWVSGAAKEHDIMTRHTQIRCQQLRIILNYIDTIVPVTLD